MKSYALIIHYNKHALKLTTSVDDTEDKSPVSNQQSNSETGCTTEVPDMHRLSMGDAVLFVELQNWLSLYLTAGLALPSEQEITEFCRSTMGSFCLHSRKSSSYPEALLHSDSPAIQRHFDMLGVKKDTNQRSPSFYLNRHFFSTAPKEQLSHVRQCEHPSCTYNPYRSALTEKMAKYIRDEILAYLKKMHPDKTKPIHYFGFACGQLLRDLVIIKDIINAGYKNLVIYLFDPSYEKLLASIVDAPVTSGLEDDLKKTVYYKAIREFSNWIAAHLNDNKDHPVKIHLFGKIGDVNAYFKSSKEKITVLVGQDFLLKEGATDKRYATESGHDDFMNLAKDALANNQNGCFFEVVKNDNKEKIYFHVGHLITGEYKPHFTHVIDFPNQQEKHYSNVSLSFFEQFSCKNDDIYVGNKYVSSNTNRVRR